MKDIIICVGISGSGKSTFANSFIKENTNYLRINRDDIRRTLVGNLDGYYQREDLNMIERNVTGIEESIFKYLSTDYRNVIIDNTNLKQFYINRWIEISGYYKYDFKFKLFDVDLVKAKDMVLERDFLPIDWNNSDYNREEFNVKYIDKQFQQYQQIKQWLLDNYKDKIL